MKIVIGLLKLILKIVAAPVVVVLTVAIWMCVGIVYSVGSYQHGHHCVGGGCPDNILPSKRYYLVGHRILTQPIWAAATGLLATGKSARFQICNTGFCLWIKRSPLHSRKGYRALRFD